MVRNLHPGDKWVPGTIIERTGPLSYVVQVAGGQIWRHHIDHLRQMDDSPQQEQMPDKGIYNDILIHFPQSETSTSTDPVTDDTTPTVTKPHQ